MLRGTKAKIRDTFACKTPPASARAARLRGAYWWRRHHRLGCDAPSATTIVAAAGSVVRRATCGAKCCPICRARWKGFLLEQPGCRAAGKPELILLIILVVWQTQTAVASIRARPTSCGVIRWAQPADGGDLRRNQWDHTGALTHSVRVLDTLDM